MPELTKDAYYAEFGSRINQDSERLFVDEFLWTLLGTKIGYIIPQRTFIDSTGKNRRIDFSYVEGSSKLAIEVNGETYHAEGIVPNEVFDDNLFRQNEILQDGYKLIRFSYSMLQSPQWRPLVRESLRNFFCNYAPNLLGEELIEPNPLQIDALKALQFYRSKGWKKGVVILPTGTGKTILSALDTKRFGGKVLFIVHRLDILKQSISAYKKVWNQATIGILTGESRENELNCDILFASKDTLRQTTELTKYRHDEFDYIVIDEVHHGQTPSYSEIFSYFKPRFMLGMTATPDRTDRKDIFEIFDYNKIFEVSLQEAIEDGYLVPYTYYGLLDNVDYSHIRYQNNRYRVDDLERNLIIPERNQAILREYMDKGSGDKAIGFCVSIQHANRMADFFNENNISAVAITSETPDRDEKIESFRRNEINIVFTVDLFNEGVDFPNVRVLMFLRPTESKTVFIQQIGRGLRLCVGKDRVRILDFIGNYQRANQIRKWLAKSSQETVRNEGNERRKKIEYTYSTGCEINFQSEVEEILDRQDELEIEVTKEDLKEAYFLLAENLGRKPSRSDVDTEGQYKTSLYTRCFNSWKGFLQEIGEYTEASYHYPQGVHLGHILSILDIFGRSSRTDTAFDDQYIRLRGGLDQGRMGSYQRQVKYKLLAAMELGILKDDRKIANGEDYVPELTILGQDLRNSFVTLLESLELNFPISDDGIPSTRMVLPDQEYNRLVAEFISHNNQARTLWLGIVVKMPAVTQMLAYLYQVARKIYIERSEIYRDFFNAPFVQQFCDQEGIEEATQESSRRRCPFLLNILESCGVISQNPKIIQVRTFLITASVVRLHRRESLEEAELRASKLSHAGITNESALDSNDVSILRELFGANFLTDNYHLTETEYIQL
ncbi:DEAD/DEAH box helicase family protein [Planktothrix agardhii]|jgi:superfamily II DNA or RNA helicase|uniref:DEAD/DEAH box helicase family protein n=1 Tax=Planktothrix agardhii TaxID=1160 RepID=UPI0020A7ABED|nr:DEAD/DEAH box helicase family protein [Planktothrix agardhii]CAD5929008.1 51,5 kDa protein [Planktothrix agardhii]